MKKNALLCSQFCPNFGLQYGGYIVQIPSQQFGSDLALLLNIVLLSIIVVAGFLQLIALVLFRVPFVFNSLIWSGLLAICALFLFICTLFLSTTQQKKRSCACVGLTG